MLNNTYVSGQNTLRNILEIIWFTDFDNITFNCYK